MSNLNSVLLEGELGQDPYLCNIPEGGIPRCFLQIVSRRYFKQGPDVMQDTGVFDVEVAGKLAEACKNLGHKGRRLRVVGHLKQEQLCDSGGKEYSRVFIEAEHVEFRPDCGCLPGGCLKAGDDGQAS
jgi:single-strand DNA-binding protein